MLNRKFVIQILLLLPLSLLGQVADQMKIVKGKVLDLEKNEAIAGVVISIENPILKVLSDESGYFELRIPKTTQHLNCELQGKFNQTKTLHLETENEAINFFFYNNAPIDTTKILDSSLKKDWELCRIEKNGENVKFSKRKRSKYDRNFRIVFQSLKVNSDLDPKLLNGYCAMSFSNGCNSGGNYYLEAKDETRELTIVGDQKLIMTLKGCLGKWINNGTKVFHEFLITLKDAPIKYELTNGGEKLTLQVLGWKVVMKAREF